jgi:hypothetical protein
MDENIIQCAIYAYKYKYGGGCWYIPIENHQSILNLLVNQYLETEMSKEYFVYYMDVRYLNKMYAYMIDEKTGLYWWDGTYSE